MGGHLSRTGAGRAGGGALSKRAVLTHPYHFSSPSTHKPNCAPPAPPPHQVSEQRPTYVAVQVHFFGIGAEDARHQSANLLWVGDLLEAPTPARAARSPTAQRRAHTEKKKRDKRGGRRAPSSRHRPKKHSKTTVTVTCEWSSRAVRAVDESTPPWALGDRRSTTTAVRPPMAIAAG